MSGLTWKTKEAKLSADEEPTLGDAKKRGIIIECITAMTMLLAGASIVILRHPDSVKLIDKMISNLSSE